MSSPLFMYLKTFVVCCLFPIHVLLCWSFAAPLLLLLPGDAEKTQLLFATVASVFAHSGYNCSRQLLRSR